MLNLQYINLHTFCSIKLAGLEKWLQDHKNPSALCLQTIFDDANDIIALLKSAIAKEDNEDLREALEECCDDAKELKFRVQELLKHAAH